MSAVAKCTQKKILEIPTAATDKQLCSQLDLNKIIKNIVDDCFLTVLIIIPFWLLYSDLCVI